MKKLTKAVSGISLGLAAAGAVQAETFNVTATVQNAIALVETTPFSLGTLYVTNNASAASTPATLTVTSAGAVSSADGNIGSKIISLDTVTLGVVSVSGAQPFGTVTVEHGTLTNLVHSSGNPALPVIEFNTLDTDPADAATVTLDANGDGDINVGGTFSTEQITTDYADGVYTGSYEINVAY